VLDREEPLKVKRRGDGEIRALVFVGLTPRAC
jgi:hypothetical protein